MYPKPILSELADLAKWVGDNQYYMFAYTNRNLTPDLAIAITKVFWPDFVTYEDGVFLAFQFDESSYISWKKQFDGDIEAVENMMNHVHLAADLLPRAFNDLSYHNIAYFGGILVNTWKCSLKTQFPDRNFEVTGEKDGQFDDFIITFWQPRE